MHTLWSKAFDISSSKPFSTSGSRSSEFASQET